MKYFVVGTLKRGAVDPPELLSPWICDAIFDAEWAAAQREPQLEIEQLWRKQGKELRQEKKQAKREKDRQRERLKRQEAA